MKYMVGKVFDDFYQNTEERSCWVTVSATPNEVREASRKWASDLGWVELGKGDSPLLFQTGRQAVLNGGLEMQVLILDGRDSRDVGFVATAHFTLLGANADLRRVAQYFAHGVCSQLAEGGAVVSPEWFGRALQDRVRIRRLEIWRKWFTLGMAIMLVPASLATWFATGDGGLGLVVGAWMVLLIVTSTEVVRRRLLGMRARPYAALMATVWFLVACVATPLIVLGAIGRL